VSSGAGGGKYGFPHLLATGGGTRGAASHHHEGRAAQDRSGARHPRHRQQTHLRQAGRVDYRARAAGFGEPLQLFRFGDTPSGVIDLAAARKVR